MPKTRNFSDREKRDAMDLLDIHDDINAVHLLTGIHHRTLRRWRKKLRRQQYATLSEKSFSLSEKRTNSEELLTNQQSENNPAPALDPTIQPPANDNAAREDSNKSNDDLQRLTYIREQLMNLVCRLAGDLDPDDPDINLRTMSLSRSLDRIQWLDQLIDRQASEPVTELETESVTKAETHDFPGWLRPRDHRSDQQRAAEKAEIARRREWAESQIR